MDTIRVSSIVELFGLIEEIKNEKKDVFDRSVQFMGSKLIIFRGQNQNYDLLPKIARCENHLGLVSQEAKMIEELRLRGQTYYDISSLDDWDSLVVAQHYGMATRLLDWTLNPLVALWFACKDKSVNKSSYVYILTPSESMPLLNKSKILSPKNQTKTSILRPNLNNPRVIAQNGWFTAHIASRKYSEIVPLNKNEEIKKELVAVKIPPKKRTSILQELDILGVNYQTMFPDIEGVCKHLNWLKL